jgi:uncharacterized Zn-binding protein involved in type VI secretion
VGAPAIVANDQITGVCSNHLIIGPLGVPTPAPALPFAAPLTMTLSLNVQIGGKPAAVVGSFGYNTPPHVGLHPSDPFFVPLVQMGQITQGSPTVQIGGQPAATAQSMATCCVVPGSLVPSVTTVLIG